MPGRLKIEKLDQIQLMARKSSLTGSLSNLAHLLLESDGYLLWRGRILIADATDLPLLDAGGNAYTRQDLLPYQDRLAKVHGISLAALPTEVTINCMADNDVQVLSMGVLALRMGLVLHILDMSHRHLSGRWSFGKKTLNHQLVKASFAAIFAGLEQLREQSRARIQRNWFTGLNDDHWQLSQLTGQAEKLMGGHGYLQEGSHGIAYLSMLLYSVYGAHHE